MATGFTDAGLAVVQFPQNNAAVASNRQQTPTPVRILRYAAQPLRNETDASFPRIAGEFEPQKAILLSVSDLMYQHNGVLKQIVEKTSTRIPIIILHNDQKQLKDTVELLETLTCDLSHVSFYNLKLDTIWLRDFGPRLAETANGAVSIDFFYEGQRPLDDKFPIKWGEITQARVNEVRWTLHGGNLLANGKGLGIATSRIFEDNFIAFPSPTPGMDVEFERRKIVVDAFKEDCHLNQLLVLEPLQPEATRHVDMFATFLAADRVLVAQVDPKSDPTNARILDYNAGLLEQMTVDGKPMKVERIMIPPRDGKFWSPYTNIIFANNLVLMPVYESDPPAIVQNAINTYRRLLPGFHVETVDMTTMRELEGALHCMSINVPDFAQLPAGLLSFAAAKTGNRDGVAEWKNPIQRNENPAANASAPGNSVSGVIQIEARAIPLITKPTEFDGWNVAKSAPNLTNEHHAESADLSPTSTAVATYRRTFVDQTGRFSIDAYAIGFESIGVKLLKINSQTEVNVSLDQLSDEDRLWLSNHADKIRSNGLKVKNFVIANGQ